MNKAIVIALDFPSSDEADALLNRLNPEECRVKIGKELFTRTGADWVRQTVARGFDVFLDLKYHDIPNTVAAAVVAAADLGVWMINVHVAGGQQMMNAAVRALEPMGAERPLLIGVTVLTSMNDADLYQIGVSRSAEEQVNHMAGLAQQSGLDGVVCSAAEASGLRQKLGSEFVLVTPGIRRPEDATGDQKRVVGPAEAVAAGSSYLVVGRPITQAADPMLALAEFNSAVAGVAAGLD